MERPLDCIVIDDEALAREGIEDYVNKTPQLKLVGSFSNAVEALEHIKTNSVDVILTDINMPSMNGMEFKKVLNAQGNKTKVVFITAYREYAIDGFELQATDYLLKPVSFVRFSQMAQNLYDLHNLSLRQEKDSFFIKVDGKLIKIHIDSILFIEGLKDYVYIHTENEKFLTLMSLKSVEEKLEAIDFCRVHRSYIINKLKVDSIEGNQIHIGSNTIPIGKSMREKVMSQLIGNKLWKRG
jgi:DNA-binding LytR/AlgR family response regulator